MAAAYSVEVIDGVLHLLASGDWRARSLGPIDRELRLFEDDSVGRDLVIDVSKVENLDTSGALVLQRVLRACTSRTDLSGFKGASASQTEILTHVQPHLAPCPVEPARENPFKLAVNRLGHGVVDAYMASVMILNFIGQVLTAVGRAITNPAHFRGTSVVHHMEESGLNAIPIVGLMSFLIGAVVAFMGAKILKIFNAEVFTVELVGLSVLREFGVLLSAILIAGRSGSAYTAQIGSMKIREEIDALRTLGLDPIEVLVVPRSLH
ncbi:MAG: ABC transporter permease [Pseudomonadota bacterium]